VAEIRSARRLMEDDQRHIGQVTELRTRLRQRLSTAERGLDRFAGPRGADTVPGRAGGAVRGTERSGRSGERIRGLRRDLPAPGSPIERGDPGRYGMDPRCDAFIRVDDPCRAPQAQECPSCHRPARLIA